MDSILALDSCARSGFVALTIFTLILFSSCHWSSATLHLRIHFLKVALARADLEGRGNREQGQECLAHCEEMVIGEFRGSDRRFPGNVAEPAPRAGAAAGTPGPRARWNASRRQLSTKLSTRVSPCVTPARLSLFL